MSTQTDWQRFMEIEARIDQYTPQEQHFAKAALGDDAVSSERLLEQLIHIFGERK